MADEQKSAGDVRVLWARGAGSAVAASGLLRAEVGRLVGIQAEEVLLTRSCPQCGSSGHGRPVALKNDSTDMPFVSLSRAGDVVVVVVSRQGSVGVDIEPMDALRFAGFDDVALHEQETAPSIGARTTTWVRKESLLKATGDALHLDPRLVRLGDPDQPPRLVEWLAPTPPPQDVWMQDLDIEGHAACLTVLSHDAPRVTLRQAVPEELAH